MIARRVIIALVLGVLLFLVALAGIIGGGRKEKAYPVRGLRQTMERMVVWKEYFPPPRI